MHRRYIAILFFVLLRYSAAAQTPVPPNIDFELGNTSHWSFYIGTCCPLDLPVATAAVPGRHDITSGDALDPYGRFPVVSPGGGNFSLKLGNEEVGGEAERAEYLVNVPAGLTNYSLIFRYAVVFEDPGHVDSAQPRFAVNAYDNATGDPIPCAQYLYIASSALPGFKDTLIAGDTSVIKYKGWTTASINLSGYGGKTVKVQFTSGDCALKGHFGYGYVDVSAGLFAASTVVCNKHEAVLSGPWGFGNYSWYNATLTQFVGSGQFISVPNPTSSTTYAVVLQPYPGYGCPDTLYTTIHPSQLDMEPIPDVHTCQGARAVMSTMGSGGAGPLKYAWIPGNPVPCADCNHLGINVEDSISIVATVSDSSGCNISDTVKIFLDNCLLTLPNAFTPNRDGKNDIFRVLGKGFEYYDNFSLSVYNRFGQRVFFTRDIYAGWDGVFNDEPQDIGTYFYMILFTLYGKQHLLKGDVTLVR